MSNFALIFTEKRNINSPLKREVQAVKSILQGTSNTAQHRDQTDVQRHDKSDKTKQKKRNLLEVFKKPSNAKEIGKPVKHRSSSHVVDKFELECIEVLKVRNE